MWMSSWGGGLRYGSGVWCRSSPHSTDLYARCTRTTKTQKYTHTQVEKDNRSHNKSYTAFLNCMCVCVCVVGALLALFFFIWLHSNLLPSPSLHTHTHIYTQHFFHPLIPNCLRKGKGEIPLQCLGSAVFGNHLLSHIVVGGSRVPPDTRSLLSRLCTICTLTDVKVFVSMYCAVVSETLTLSFFFGFWVVKVI